MTDPVKVSKMEFEFEYPGEFSDEEVEEMTIEAVMESLRDSHTHPEISMKETDPFIVGVMELAEKAKQDMIACAYNVARSGNAKRRPGPGYIQPFGEELTGELPKIFMAAYGQGMGEAWMRGLSMNAQAEATYMAHFM